MRRDGAYGGSGTATPAAYWEHLASATPKETRAAWDDARKLGIALPATSCMDAKDIVDRGVRPSSQGVMNEIDAARRLRPPTPPKPGGRLGSTPEGSRSSETGRGLQRYWEARNGLDDREKS